jgi:ribonuclease BN (tRNA processing enzyme)
MPASFRLILLGTGTPDPRPRRGGSSTLVLLDERAIIFDLGPGATHNLDAAGVDPVAVGHLFFTHHHFDHNADYGHFVLTRWDQGAGGGNELAVYGPPPTARITRLLFDPEGVYGADLEARTQHPMSQQIFRERGGTLPRLKPTVQAHDLELGETVAGDGWTVRTGPAHHAQPYLRSLSYRLDTDAGSLVISGDTTPLPELAAFARDAHTLVHMGMDLDEARQRLPDVYGACSTARQAGQIAAQAGVSRLVMVHLGRSLDDPARRAAMVDEARDEFSGEVVAGEDLLELAIGG